MSKYKTIVIIMMVICISLYVSTNKVNAINTEYDYNTEYTLNEYFGEGDYLYLKDYLNVNYFTEDKTTYSPAQLATVSEIKIKDLSIVDLPNDFSIFNNLESLELINITNLQNISFKYINTNSKLEKINLQDLNDAITISNLDIQFTEDNDTHFNVNTTIKLEEFKNNDFENGNKINLSFENINSDILAKMYQDDNYYNELGEDNKVVNSLINRNSLNDLKLEANYKEIAFENNSLNDFDFIQINYSIISDVAIASTKPTLKFYVNYSLINSVSLDAQSEVEAYKTANILLGGLYTNELSFGNIENYNYVHLQLAHNSIEKIKMLNTLNVDDFSLLIYATYIKEINDINNNNDKPMAGEDYEISAMHSTINKIGNIKSYIPYSSFYNYIINFDNSVFETIESINTEINSDASSEIGSEISVNINNSRVDKINKIDITDTTIEGFTQLVLFNTEVNQLGPINLKSSITDLNLSSSTVNEVNNVSMLGDNNSFNVVSTTGIAKYGNIKLDLKEYNSDIVQKNSFSIKQDAPISKIGDIYIDDNHETNDNIFIIDNYMADSNKITSIGALTLKAVTTVEIIDMGVESIGLIDIPRAKSLDLSNNQLVKLEVNNNMFSDNLVAYNFNGNQIVGDLPIKETNRDVDSFKNNYFNIALNNVSKQNSLVMEYMGNTYYSQDINNLNSLDLPIVEIVEDSVLDMSPLKDNISLYNNDNPVSLFPNHSFTYEIYPSTTRLNELSVGENLVAITLGNATSGKLQNTNAKILIKVKVIKKAGAPIIDEKPGNPITGEKPGSIVNQNPKVDNIVKTGITLPIGLVISSSIIGFVSFVYYNKYRKFIY